MLCGPVGPGARRIDTGPASWWRLRDGPSQDVCPRPSLRPAAGAGLPVLSLHTPFLRRALGARTPLQFRGPAQGEAA